MTRRVPKCMKGFVNFLYGQDLLSGLRDGLRKGQ